MATPALNPLVTKIRSAHPGAYDDMDDASLTKAVLAKYPQYSNLAAPPTSSMPGAPSTQPMKEQSVLPGSPETGLQGAVAHLGDTWNAVGKPITDVSAPVIAGEIYKKFQGQPNELKELPGKMVTAFAMGTEPGAEGEAVALRPRAEAPRVEAPVGDMGQPGAIGRAMEIAKRRIGHIPGVQAVKDLDYLVRGSGEPPPPPSAPPAPSVPDNWGKGQFGTPVDQWGSRIPHSQPPTPSPKAVPFERGKLQELLNQSLDAAPPPDPKAPIYQRGQVAQKMAQPSNFPTPESRAASDAAFRRHYPNEEMNVGSPLEKDLWQQSVFGEKPPEDIGAKARAKNPEPTRAEARGAALKNELAKVSPQQAPQYSADKAIYKGSTFEHKGGQFFKDGKLLEKGDDIADAVDALEAPKGKVIEAQPLQRGSIAKQLNAADVPEGHTPVTSEALKSYKYDPQAREFHAQYNSNPGKVHIFGDVGPEEAQAFEAAKSKGTAMQAIRRNPEVARIINGKRIAVKPVTK